MKKNGLLIFFVLLTITGFSQKKKSGQPLYQVPANYCISADEKYFGILLNQLREKNALEPLTFSTSLCFVAQTHVKDIAKHPPDSDFCNLHSWSSYGKWKQCCYNKTTGNTPCMTEKPHELTGFKGKGYEIVYFSNDSLNAWRTFDFWQEDNTATDFFLSRNKWEDYSWKSMGIGIYKGLTAVWLSVEKDNKQPLECEIFQENKEKANTSDSSTKTVKVIEESQRFHLIYGNYSTLEKANETVKTLHRNGFSGACVLSNSKNIRVSLANFPTIEKAKKEKEKLNKKYTQIWILKQ